MGTCPDPTSLTIKGRASKASGKDKSSGKDK